jgi:chloride channel 2
MIIISVTVVNAVLLYLENSIGFGDGSSSVNVSTFGSFMFDQQSEKVAIIYLVIFFGFKFFVTAIAVTLPLPVGLFTPVFICGGVLGRILGEIIVPLGITSFQPWEFAIIGAAAFSTGVTRAISTALIVYELSGEPNLRLPLSIAILCSYFIGNRFTNGIYDVIIDSSSAPYLQQLPVELYAVPVSKIMEPTRVAQLLTMNSTYRDVKHILSRNPDVEVFPVVSSTLSMNLVGAILREDLRRSLRRFEAGINKYRNISCSYQQSVTPEYQDVTHTATAAHSGCYL